MCGAQPTALVVRLDAEQRIHLGVERVDVDAARLEGRAAPASALQIGAVAPAELRSVAAPSATSIVIPRAVWKSTFVCECRETASIACASTTTSDAFASLGRVSVSVFTSASVSIGSSGARRSAPTAAPSPPSPPCRSCPWR